MRIIIVLFLFIGCVNDGPKIVVPETFKIGQSFDFKVTGLVAKDSYDLIANKEDSYNRKWISRAAFVADANGQIDLSSSNPVDGSYHKSDPYGLFWSMTMAEEPDDEWVAPKPRDFSTIDIFLIKDTDTIDHVSTIQWIIPESIETHVSDSDIVAEYMKPANSDQRLPGIILLGGSGGGLSWAKRMGALLADEGYATMALAYFNAEGLPRHLAQIPLEYIDKAINDFAKKEYVDNDRIGLLGYSKGAELALLAASRRNEITSVAAIAPGSAVFQGFKPPKYPILSSWSLAGEDLPFVPNAYDQRFFETYDGMYLWYRTLAQHAKVEEAAIPVENINGEILLISGIKDQIWPTTYMSEQIISRLHIAAFEHAYEHIALPFAGHGIAEPPGHPTTSLSQRLGGTAAGNAKAREEVWIALKQFFKKSFKPE